MGSAPVSAVTSRWELAAEAIAVKIRWFGLIAGYVLVNVDRSSGPAQPILNAILALGAVYALIDTYYSLRGRVFLARSPLAISLMEALFIGVLCYYHGGLESSFRYFYLLSLICCAVRNSSRVTFATYALHCTSYTVLYLVLPPEQRQPLTLVLTLVLLGWVSWASDALAMLLKHVGEHLAHLNSALKENQSQLEARIAERSRELQEAQAHVLHQEKMAAFGLLAAGIAHEVGNPLTSISTLVQMLQRRDAELYTKEKLTLVSGQLQRIQGTLRELVNFSRPASSEWTYVSLAEIVDEALSIAKYYHGTKSRIIQTDFPADLPRLYGVRDQLVQVFLNLVLNAVDATSKAGAITIEAKCTPREVEIVVRDDGAGIAPEHLGRLFQPYFTTKPHGTGLGLFVSRKLIKDHGGDIVFESRVGEGTIVRLRLPPADVRAAVEDPARLLAARVGTV
jgi:two-component system, NtrC family, sensor kinase